MRTPLHLCWLFGVLMASGCNWTDREEWDNAAVWSDDGSAALGVYQYYEGQNTTTHTRKRNMETAIHYFADVRDPDASRVILPRARGWARPLYLSSRQGYAIVHRHQKLPDLDDGGNQTAIFTAHHVNLDTGRVTGLGQTQYLSMISCDPEGQTSTTTGHVLSVIPSPDGRVLAKVEMRTTCQGKTGTITFLDGNTLRVLDGPTAVTPFDDPNLLVDGAWTEDGQFILAAASFAGPRGTLYGPNIESEPIEGIDYSCLYPATSSSTVNAAGETIEVVDGVLNIRAASPPVETFGCD